MTKAQLISFIRTQIDDTVAPYRVSDTDLGSWIDEAEREAAERARLFKLDTTVSLVANTATYTVSNVIELTRVKVSGESRPLIKTTRRELDFELGPWDAQAADTPKFYFQIDDQIALYPKPDASGTLIVQGFRYRSSEMETPTSLQESLAYWPMYRYYSMNDIDSHNPANAQFFEDKFASVFGKKKNQQFVQSWRNDAAYSSMDKSPFDVGSSTNRSLF